MQSEWKLISLQGNTTSQQTGAVAVRLSSLLPEDQGSLDGLGGFNGVLHGQTVGEGEGGWLCV